jgi:hypothetical protein
LSALDRLDDEAPVTIDQRQALDPSVATSTIVKVWMNEPATDVPPCATIRTHKSRALGPSSR